MKPRFQLAAGLILVALALLVQVPATLLAGVAGEASGERCRLAAAQGTLWAGSSQLYLRSDVDAVWQYVGRLHWRFGFAGLQIGLDAGQLALEAIGGGLTLTAGGLRLPAALVLDSVHGLPRSGWGGDLELAEAEAKWLWGGLWRGAWRARGIVRWQGARTSLLPVEVLGDYRLQFQGSADSGTKLQLSTERGILALAGSAQLAADGILQADGEAQPDASVRAVIEPLLRDIGHPVAGSEGRYRIRWPSR